MFFPLAEQEVGSGGTYIVVGLRDEVRDITLLWPAEYRHRRVHTSGRIYMSHHTRGDGLKMTYLDSCYPLTIDHIDHRPSSARHSNNLPLPNAITHDHPPLESD